jgi:hypothetical protein
MMNLRSNLSKNKKKFYLEIYTPTKEHDEAINAIYTIMKQDFMVD